MAINNTRKWSAFVVLCTALATASILFSSCNADSQTQRDNTVVTESPTSQPASTTRQTTNASGPVGDKELALAVDSLIDTNEFAAARWGISVITVKDGRTLYERNADKLFTPASNMKLFPTGVALELLGPDYHWRTSVYAATQPDAGGTLNGDLILYGRGAPDLVAQTRKEGGGSLAQLADDLYNHGLRRVTGNVIGDESYFRGDPVGDGWQWNDMQWYFGAEASALTVNNNEVGINVFPPEKSGETPLAKVTDDSGYVTVMNEMKTVDSSEKLTMGIHRGLSDNTVSVWGTFPSGSKGFGARLSVHQPSLWAARLFLEALKSHGITIEGGAQSRDSRQPPSERFDPSKATELAFTSSKSLGEIAKQTNKGSINLYAELILRTLGRERGTLISATETGGRERGDDEVGLGIIRVWLSRAGVSTEGMALHDGSGLSRLDLISPRAFTSLLKELSHRGSASVFRDSLPLAGRDGTLGGRLGTLADRVSAKTGSLTYDNALTGYVNAANGEVLAFSIICNDEVVRHTSTRAIDQIVSVLAAYPGPFKEISTK